MYRINVTNLLLVLLFILLGKSSLYAQSNKTAAAVKPHVTFAGKDSGNISLSNVKQYTGITVNASYKIAQFTIVINSSKAGAKPLTYYTLMSNEFSKEVIKDLAERGADVAIILDEIKAKDPSGNIIKVAPSVFHVVADK